ncbi:hypothetical protein LIER_31927 [Lithospermum erythrorhizon]|uniref:Reverse transcriptase zinc-binding domain-containing protein n=1 Tax=Lithospermum erythrorhizon TaxID=34254 RepID=A0AAV3RW23_LITER
MNVEGNNIASTSSTDTQIFKHIWQLDVPGKIKHFIPKASHNRLATMDNLLKRYVQVPDISQFCEDMSETIMHVFHECKYVKEVNRLLNIKDFTLRVWDFRDLVKEKWKRLSPDKFCIWVLCMWDIWHQRILKSEKNLSDLHQKW